MGSDQSTVQKQRVFSLPPERDGESPIYRNICLKTPEGSKPLLSRWNNNINSVYESFMYAECLLNCFFVLLYVLLSGTRPSCIRRTDAWGGVRVTGRTSGSATPPRRSDVRTRRCSYFIQLWFENRA
jgi:hypothetical protein